MTKTLQLYQYIKDKILDGQYHAGEKLPSKRTLAKAHSVSVITAEQAYELLEEEGYLTARERSGYYVNKLTKATLRSAPADALKLLPEEENDTPISLTYVPALARITRKILSERPEILQRKPPQYGCSVLRNAIAGYLRRSRNMTVQPANIMIGSGSEQFYGLTVQLFGREVPYGIEDPSYEKIALVYRANGATVRPLPMERDGISETALRNTDARVLHITPYHSYPTGITASADKRYAYLAWAEEKEAYLIEDDFDSEFAYFRKPIDPLYSMDGIGRVLYMNTFSKSLSPAIRIAYMILPDALLPLYRERLSFHSCTVPVLDQYVLASYIESGSFERHLNRLRRAEMR